MRQQKITTVMLEQKCFDETGKLPTIMAGYAKRGTRVSGRLVEVILT
jgi:hypothetical protein